MEFLRDLFKRLRRIWIYLVLFINFLIAWPVFSITISTMERLNSDLNIEQRIVHFWTYFLQGYSVNLNLLISISTGTAILYTLLYAWLRFKRDRVLERHYIRSLIGGSLMAFINLFPAFLIFQWIHGRNDSQSLLISLIGPFLALGIMGPTAILAGCILGLINGLLVHVINYLHRRWDQKKEESAF